MESGQAIKNIRSSIILQIATALSGFILPHFFIKYYGSAINGMVSSITQFLSYLALVEAGISASAIVELYKPLDEGNEEERNYVLSATKRFYLQSGIIYVSLLVVLLFSYPLLIEGQTDRITTVLMILVLAGSNIIDYFILGKYRVLLSADQRLYVLNNIQSIGTALNVVLSIVLMLLNQSVILVKFVATFIYACRTIFVVKYVDRNYHNISFKVATLKTALPQRWNALFHQIVGVICNNTDIILITVCLGSRSLIEASVYYVFSLATNMFTSLASSLSNAITPTFGRLMVSEHKQSFESAFDTFEFVYFILFFSIYSCVFALLLPFVSVYTASVNDANYIRPELALLFATMGLIQNIRIPSLSVICAAGHYKQTQWRAFAEAAINLSVSIVLIFKLGIAGAVIGTICSYAYRSFDSIIYIRRFFDHQILGRTFSRLLRNGAVLVGVVYLINRNKVLINSWIDFFFNGLLLFLITSTLFVLANYLFEPKKLKDHYAYIKKRIQRKGIAE